MKTSRRKALKTLGLSTLALVINPFSGCENPIEYLTDIQENGASNLSALNTVNEFCQDNLSGDFYNKIQSLNKSNSVFSPAYDFFAVANSYKIIGTKTKKRSVQVFVEYDYVGVHKGNEFFFYEPKNKTNKIVAKYIVKNGKIQNGKRPILQKELYKKQLKNSIANIENIIIHITDESKKAHFIKKIETYSNTLSLLS